MFDLFVFLLFINFSNFSLKCKYSNGEGFLTKNVPAKTSKFAHFSTLRVSCVPRFLVSTLKLFGHM